MTTITAVNQRAIHNEDVLNSAGLTAAFTNLILGLESLDKQHTQGCPDPGLFQMVLFCAL